ncbi:putative MPP superfamily phosphohydrolase [Blautia caecimuris]|uniref:MPP superfamily phosphohydrolase n=1 Tax=Blautia caecimuris TaxID=1796615 RepID=A0ABV2M6Z7_9FIRM
MISNYWLGILLYLILAVLMADAICFLLFLITKRRLKCRTAAAGGICAVVVLGLSAWGAYNARIIQVTPYEITVNKDGGRLENLNVVLAADLHLGYNIGTAHMMQMVDKINEQNADIVVFAGDIFDNEYEALDDPEELIAVLQKIQSKYGVYACYGNHDVEEKILAGFTFGGNKKKESSIQMDEFLERAGIHLLQDEAVLIDDSFYLYGRPDAQRPGRGINMRKTAAELMGELDTEKPVIVIDHEPKELQELADAGVDIDLCGHTHDGQMFPANLITALMWENSYGYLKKDHMHTIVTSGVGLFGPNMRVGTIAEICPITVHFQYRNNI